VKLHVVLVKPEIPGNTGQVGRSCMALGVTLHLVHPLGFEISDKHLKRAGMDYWPQVDLMEHPDVANWMQGVEDLPVWLMSTKGTREFDPSLIEEGAHLVFGNESSGLPDMVWQRHGERSLRLPMAEGARSLNLSASVAMALGALRFRGK